MGYNLDGKARWLMAPGLLQRQLRSSHGAAVPRAGSLSYTQMPLRAVVFALLGLGVPTTPFSFRCAFIFLSTQLVYISTLYLSGGEVCTPSLDDDIDLSSSTLTLCCLKRYLQLVLVRRHLPSPLPLPSLRRAGWLLPAPLPFMHTHVQSQLSHTPGSRILHMKIIGPKLPFFACLCLIWVPQAPARPLPMCRSTAVLQSLPPGASPHGPVSPVLRAHLLLLGCPKSSSAF